MNADERESERELTTPSLLSASAFIRVHLRVHFFGGVPSMRTFAALCLGLLTVAPATQAQQINLLDAGSRSQLLADPSIVYDAKGIVFTPHAARKHPSNPLLKPDRP